MLSLLPWWRENGWHRISAGDYSHLWHKYGGSVMSHPEIIERLSGLAGIPVRYFGKEDGGDYLAGIATWGRHLALSRNALKAFKKKHAFDLGNAETILPAKPGTTFGMRFKARYVAALHCGQIITLRPQPESIALARLPEDYRGKFLYNRRRELAHFLDGGGTVLPVSSLPANEISSIYTHLFELRWGFEVPAKKLLPEAISLLHKFMTGSVLFIGSDPVGIQILYRVESPNWISVEYINGGVDPLHHNLSLGSVLTFLNTQAAWGDARRLGKELRYSFGRADREYKMRWCIETPAFRT